MAAGRVGGEGCSASESARFGALYQQQRIRARGVAISILGDEDDAEDVVQEVFAGLWSRRDSPFCQATLSAAWLRTIVRSRAIDRLRHRGRRHRAEQIDEGCSPIAELTLGGPSQSVLSALQQLPDLQRRPLELVYFEGCTHREAARHLNVPTGTVKTRVRLGLKCLAGILRRGSTTEAVARRARGISSDTGEDEVLVDPKAAAEISTWLDTIAGQTSGTELWFSAVRRVALDAHARQATPGLYRLVRDWARQAVAVVVPAGRESMQLESVCLLGRLLLHAGWYQDAANIAESARELLGRAGASALLRGHLYRLLGSTARHFGDLEGDLRNYERALAAFIEVGEPLNICNARISVAFSHLQRGEWALADALLTDALRTARALGFEEIATRAQQNVGLLAALRDDSTFASQHLRSVADESRRSGNRRFEGWTRIYLARLHNELGDGVTANAEARSAAALCRESPSGRAGALAALSTGLLAQRRTTESLAVARDAYEIVRSLGGIEEFEWDVRLALCEALRALGLHGEARRQALQARARVRTAADGLRQDSARQSFAARVPAVRRILAMAAGA